MSNGRGETRFAEAKRTFPKPINISAQVLLDRERCVLCARCTRFSEQIAGDPFIALLERGALQQVGIYEKEPFESYFSGNAIQICPVGALTSATYRFRARPFDLVSTPSIAEHDACGSAIRVDHRRGKVVRRLAGNDPAVNEEWITDKDRFAFGYAAQPDRLTHPLVREDGELRPASWPEALAVAARGLKAAGSVGVLTGGRLTLEDAYAYSKFARLALRTNDIDFRSRPHSAEEAEFLASTVAATPVGVTFESLEQTKTILLLGLEPEEEAGALFLRLRKAAKAGARIFSVTPFAIAGPDQARWHRDHRRARRRGCGHRRAPAPRRARARRRWRRPGGRAARDLPGCAQRAPRPGRYDGRQARLGPAPRRRPRSGRGRLPAEPAARRPSGRRRPCAGRRRRRLGHHGAHARRPRHRRHPRRAVRRRAQGTASSAASSSTTWPTRLPPARRSRRPSFVVSLEVRRQRRDRAGRRGPPGRRRPPRRPARSSTGRAAARSFDKVLDESHALPDLRVLAGIAEELGVDLGFRTATRWPLRSPSSGRGTATAPPRRRSAPGGADGIRLATWKLLIDDGRMLDGDAALEPTGRTGVALVSAADLRPRPASTVTSRSAPTTARVELPVAVADLPDGVVWAPSEHRRRQPRP